MHFNKIALIGNPNAGKSSLFNKLTGLHQKVSNYPGTTVEKKSGYFTHQGHHFELIDLPGIYSLYPNSKDEEIVYSFINSIKEGSHFNNIFIADGSNLKRSLFLYEQLQDMGLPVVFALNMIDEAQKKGILIDDLKLATELSQQVILINARKGLGIEHLKKELIYGLPSSKTYFQAKDYYPSLIEEVQKQFDIKNDFKAWLYLISEGNKQIEKKKQSSSNPSKKELALHQLIKTHKVHTKRLQVKETLERYKQLDTIIEKTTLTKKDSYKSFSEKLDRYLLHPFWGYCLLFLVLFFGFQFIFLLADIPRGWIEDGLNSLSTALDNSSLLGGPLRDLLSKGLIPGLSGVFSFIPQISILLFFLLLIEETGYINRIVFLMDRFVRPFGLSGKSLIGLLSGAACSIPAIISTRNIENTRSRLITILIIPFITCSARLPIYLLLVGFIIPNDRFLGVFSLQGVVLMGLYVIGILAALFLAIILNKVLKKEQKRHLIMDMPPYRFPVLKNIFISLYLKVKYFLLDAGKIIITLSILIWGLSSFSPASIKDFFSQEKIIENKQIPLEDSFLGIMGKALEPVFSPLGYDWKISIGILCSFAAREVFISTMSLLYHLEQEDEVSLKNNMRKELNKKEGKPLYSKATCFSLLIFYALAMQCLSTLAIVRQETNSWKWPLMQFTFMSFLAYIGSFFIYQLLK